MYVNLPVGLCIDIECVCVYVVQVHDIQLGKLREVYTVPALFSVVRAKWRLGHKHHVTRSAAGRVCRYIQVSHIYNSEYNAL